MTVQKQSVSFTEVAYAFAKQLVVSGEYPNVSAAVSGELAKAKAARDAETALLEAEVARRTALPLDQWEPLSPGSAPTERARAYLASRKTS